MVDVCERSLDKDKDGWYHPNPKYLPYPSRHVSIRGVEEETYCAIDVTKMGQSGGLARILEEVETRRALFELYEGAIVSIAPSRQVIATHLQPVHSPRTHVLGQQTGHWIGGNR
jgi:ATP-dependent helicase YprA (DUF1998 family)